MTRMKKILLASPSILALCAAPLEAVVPPARDPMAAKVFRNPALRVESRHTPLGQLDQSFSGQLARDLAALGVPPEGAFWDQSAGRWGTLLMRRPLIPGTGVGNTLAWSSFAVAGKPTEAQVKAAAWNALTAYLEATPALGVDVSELSRSPRVGIQDSGALVQIYAQRVLGGVPVRDSQLSAVINHGNLVMVAFDNWAATSPSLDPAFDGEAARSIVAGHARPFEFNVQGKSRLELVPVTASDPLFGGFEYRLMWVVRGRVPGSLGSWEALVDAASGELHAFTDTNQYDSVKSVIGGVFPVSNDGTPPDGVEAPNFPMPFLNVTLPDGSTRVTNTGGTLGCAGKRLASDPGGNLMRTRLSGPYVTIDDVCTGAGNIDEKWNVGSVLPFNLGAGPGTDCTVPLGHRAGDTHASRTGFYELNKIIEQARSYLPANDWVRSSLVSNMNINQSCNAFWGGGAVNFYRDRNSQCRNTGEIAAVFDHEWGHGMDNNGVNPNIAPPGEGIADMHSILRLQDSCMGRGFFKTGNCGGYGDPCTACSGVRDLDWALHVSGQPANFANWIFGGPGGGCPPPQGGAGPCGLSTHCEGHLTAQSVWDLYARDLKAAPFSLDNNTSLELSTRLVYAGSQLVGNWYQCDTGTQTGDGCAGTNGYMQFLLADDDNGNPLDGTPHMTAIHAAFNRHGVACATPTPVNSGCTPLPAPVVTATASDQGANLTWTTVPGATAYRVYRTEGVRGCDFGKVLIAEVSAATLSHQDLDLMNSFTYYYTVQAVGAGPACGGLHSTCASVTPSPGANLHSLPPGPIQVVSGDADVFLDNCETGRVSVTVENNGVVPLTNVRVTAITSPTHPGTVALTPLPATIAASLAPCEQATLGSIDFQPHGMAPDQTFQVQLLITADQLAPQTRTVTYSVKNVESDLQPTATRTWNFNASLENWTVAAGTFNRQETSPGSGDFYVASSSCLDNQCDIIRSPLVVLQTTSTLSLNQRYDTETPTPIPYDRANVGLFEEETNVRTPVSPNSGDPYDLAAGAANGVCGTSLQAGWSADTDPGCAAPGGPLTVSSSWSPSALNASTFAGRKVRLAVHYGTDPGANGYGFHFDNVTLTNFGLQIPDTQVCLAPQPAQQKPTRGVPGRKAAATRRAR
jgi:hypothetical protein